MPGRALCVNGRHAGGLHSTAGRAAARLPASHAQRPSARRRAERAGCTGGHKDEGTHVAPACPGLSDRDLGPNAAAHNHATSERRLARKARLDERRASGQAAGREAGQRRQQRALRRQARAPAVAAQRRAQQRHAPAGRRAVQRGRRDRVRRAGAPAAAPARGEQRGDVAAHERRGGRIHGCRRKTM